MTPSKQHKQLSAANPFFSAYGTPHEAVPFDRIKLEHFKTAILEGIRQEAAEIDQIVNNPEPPTFQNTIVALENTGRLLGRASTVMENLMSAHTSDELEALAEELMPQMSEHSNNIMLNSALFARIKTVYDAQPDLDLEEKELLRCTYEAFSRRGVGLPDDQKKILREISLELSQTALQFSQNVLKDQNNFVLHITKESDLQGLPEHQKELAAAAARERNFKEGWAFTLQGPSYGPFMTYADNRKLRRKLYMAYNTLCIHPNGQNNIELVRRLVNLRLKFAQTLGYKTFADFALQHRMAENVTTVDKFLSSLIRAYKSPAKGDLEAIRQMARELEGEDFQLQPWDISYYSHKLQLKRFNLDAEMLRPYFELSKVKKGVFGLATKLYGITFRRNRNIPVYHKDVEAYEVFDKDGSYLALLYTDFFPRKSKKSGAWMTSYQGQWREKNGSDVRPHVSLTMNLTKPTPDKPALLTLGEVSTFLHEFGHGLHEMFSRCRFHALSGTNVYWDFVELPSQFMENYATEQKFLKTFASHYQTGEPLPENLIERIRESQTFNAAYACMRQISLGLLDMAYYKRQEPIENEDIISFEKRAWHRAILFPQRLRVCMSTQFQHIMTGGYAAGYYCYKWAEVLDADVFSRFKKDGIFNKETAEQFRRCILEKGATQHPKVLFQKFMGRNPSVKALLERDGLGKRAKKTPA
ncbi:MAG: M3 family metallopeptidase [Bacteroidaceae bacterium]|nr:M3 family metallopeptidase [Bacteroidaceae bacterium]